MEFFIYLFVGFFVSFYGFTEFLICFFRCETSKLQPVHLFTTVYDVLMFTVAQDTLVGLPSLPSVEEAATLQRQRQEEMKRQAEEERHRWTSRRCFQHTNLLLLAGLPRPS